MRSALKPILLNSTPGWVRAAYPGAMPSVVQHFDERRAWVQGSGQVDPTSLLTTTRASNETSLLPSSAAGAAYLTFSSNVPAIVPGLGLQKYQAATNLLLNSAAPVTQTTASLGTGTYTLWVNGSGSATSSAGSATGSSFGAATNGTPNTFTLSVAGTVVITVSGSLNAFQLESGSSGTPFILTAGVTAARAADDIQFMGMALTTAIALSKVSAWAYAKFTSPPSTSAAAGVLAITDDGPTNVIDLQSNVGGALVRAAIEVSGSATALPATGTATSNLATTAAASWSTSAAAIAVNGGAAATTSNTALPTGQSKVRVGAIENNNNSLNNYIQRIALGAGYIGGSGVTALSAR